MKLFRRQSLGDGLAPNIDLLDVPLGEAKNEQDFFQALRVGVAAMGACASVLTFETSEPDGVFVEVGGVAAPREEIFENKGFLLRWLRVNAELLDLGREDVQAELSEGDASYLKRVQARASLPLVYGGSLLAFCLLCSADRNWQAAGSKEDWREAGRRAAWRLRRLVADRRERDRAAIAYRSHQLSAAAQLTATTVHEIRNPLTVIRSTVQVLRDHQGLNSNEASVLSDVMREVDRVSDVLSGILGVARPVVTTLEKIDLRTVLLEATGFMSGHARRNGIAISVAADLELWVHCDHQQMKQVFVNVLLNACQACGNGKHVIKVKASAQRVSGNPMAVVDIEDDGVGIASADIDRVFEPFYTTRGDGTGLGLAVCREIIRAHDGDISLSSAGAKGTCVTLRLPLSVLSDGSHPSY